MQFSSLRPRRPRNYPARTVIVRIVKRTPSFLYFRVVIRLSRRLQLPSTHIPTNFTAGPSCSFDIRAHRRTREICEPRDAAERK